MDISVQPKLLKAIEEKKVTRLGGVKPIKTDIKIVSAVNQNPLKCIEDGKMREDLFYRLSVVQMNIPPLRDRQNDLFYLVDYFIASFNKSMNKNIIGIDEEVESLFKSHSWPGNVRELKNVIEGAYNVTSNRLIQKKDLPGYLSMGYVDQASVLTSETRLPDINSSISLNDELQKYERAIIASAVNNSINLVEASKLLGITKQSLNYKLSKYDIKKDQ